ncbi:GNAT family protein [Massilia sp. W12]|uniref:GNAT family N-acetyltransferase n=1 Tax=Massilia sp. W12 TaxID=3126507 RepID=UPI0030D5D374
MLSRDGVHMRHIRQHDLEQFWHLINDLQARGEYLPAGLHSHRKFIAAYEKDGFSSEEFERLLLLNEAGEIIGTLWHFKSTPYFSAREIGYVLFQTAMRRQGVMSTAVGMLVDYLFQTQQINRLEIRMDVDNVASERVAQKCGFSKEGVSRGANFVRGRYRDMCVYALLRAEWEQGRA